jgi:hypothetical protein
VRAVDFFGIKKISYFSAPYLFTEYYTYFAVPGSQAHTLKALLLLARLMSHDSGSFKPVQAAGPSPTHDYEE